ncbi:unnamed protein product [Rodentolepis nana]|uniref:BZIP domain-containing protein n=1 Tax=Rodentolepis nana TaxID=102285 RepID=A0A0R3TAX1_RODNA|nr:unnamed protein product [Rodentolepis nana]
MQRILLFALVFTVFYLHHVRCEEIDNRTSTITKVTIETLPHTEKAENETENQRKITSKAQSRRRSCFRGRCRKRKIYTRLEDIEKELERREQVAEMEKLEREIERREFEGAKKNAPKMPTIIHQVIITIK